MRTAVAVGLAVASVCAVSAAGSGAKTDVAPLVEGGAIGDAVLEAFLAPGEFPKKRFVHVISGAEAAFSLDSSLESAEPFAELHPERVKWPKIAGLDLRVEGEPVRLKAVGAGASDKDLDAGFTVSWEIVPLGQRFEPIPYFAARVVAARVISSADSRALLEWRADPPPPICATDAAPGKPYCDLPDVSREAQALALSPDGKMLALALGGLRPRLELYDVSEEPRLSWQALFPAGSGGVVEVAFSADAEWVVALTGLGRMHRFGALRGDRHISVQSEGRTAKSIPPGRIMAVAGVAGEVSLWYLADGTIAWRLPQRKLRGPIDRLTASGDGKRFATLEYDEKSTVVRVWDIQKREMMVQIEVDPYSVADIALDGDGKTLFVSHESQGLLFSSVEKGATPRPVGGGDSSRCRGKLHWIQTHELLLCAVGEGVLWLDRRGREKGLLKTGTQASGWIAAVASEGGRLAAVGGGHLLIWKIGKD